MIIRAQLRAMASSDILRMIPADQLAEIKKEDPTPMFKAFVVGHEGEAKGNLIGMGNVVKRWFRGMIEKLFNKIKVGLELFQGHAETNDHAGRESIGYVVAKKLQEGWRGLEAIAVCYIRPRFRSAPLDVASIEADIDMKYEPGANLLVTDVHDVTGIALGNSGIETPGFPGATLLGQLQAFAKFHIKENQLDKPTAEEIKQLIREAGLQPSEIFGIGEIVADPAIKEQMREKNVSPEVYYEMRETKRRLAETEKRLAETGKEKSALEAQIKAKDEAIKTSTIEAAKTRVPSLFEKAKAERKLEEKQSKFIAGRLTRFVPQKPEDVEKEFNTYLDGEVEDFKRIAKDVFGVEEKAADDETRNAGTGPDGKTKDTTVNKYLDPAQNPMIRTTDGGA